MDAKFGMDRNWKLLDLSALALRLALAASFLSAVADRFGIWGKSGEPRVSWGDFGHFIAYTARLTSIVPQNLVPSMAWIATVSEIVLALALLVGWQTRTAALLTGSLLLLFALAMAFSLGIKAPLDFSVFSAATGAFLLSGLDRYKLSLDDRKSEVGSR
jgi:putative oxidoreductase